LHLMYVDESGDCGYPAPGDAFPVIGGPTRYFVRAGVVLHGWKWMHVHQMVEDFKRSRGLPWDAEIKAAHLRRAMGPFRGWPPQERRQFLLDLLDSIGREMDVSILIVAIDKERVDRDQRERFTNPSVRSLELMLERYNGFLGQQRDKSGMVILDAVESVNDENLRYFQSYLLQFSNHIEVRRIVEGALFMPSHTSNLLQLADVCTNVAYRRYTRPDGNEDEMRRIRGRVHAEKQWP
jgi:hypothetical protein